MLTSLLGEPVYIRFNSIMIGLFEVRFLICISAHGSNMGFWVGARRACWIHLNSTGTELGAYLCRDVDNFI